MKRILLNIQTLPALSFSLTLLLLGLLARPAVAQQSPLYSQYVFNRLAINPAYAGSQQQFQLTTLHRRQWDNFAGAPVTNTIIAHQALKDKNVGIGLMASHDKIGVHSDQRVYAAYAYKIKLVRGTLALGLQAGFSRLQSDFSQLNTKTDDPLARGTRNTFSPNFGTGLYYATPTFFAGVSVPYLLNSRLSEGAGPVSISRAKRYYFLTAGRVFTLSPLVKVLPSVLLRVQEGQASSAEVGANLIVNEVLTVGASYRSEDALVGLLKLELSEHLSTGYSYDHTLSAIGAYSQGSHELMLSYRIPFTKHCNTYF